MIPPINEAQLRGINLRQLRKEAFTTLDHIQMVTMHDVKTRAYWNRKHAQSRHDKLKSSKRVFFSEAQLKIAYEAQNKENK